MKRTISRVALLPVLLTALAGAARSQTTCGIVGNASATCATPVGTLTVAGSVQKVVLLSVTNPTFGLTAPTNADYTAGSTTTKTNLSAQTITVKSNASWTLQIRGAVWTGTGNNGKAIGDLSWTSNGSTFNTMTASNVQIGSGTATAGSSVTIGYRTVWSLVADTPGTYSMAISFTVTAP